MKKYVALLTSSTYLLASAPSALAAITNSAIPGGDISDAGQAAQFAKTFATLWQTVIIVGGLAFIMYFLWGGIEWITAGGDKGKIETARAKITQGLIGLAILAASFVIVKFLQTAVGLDLLNIVWPSAASN